MPNLTPPRQVSDNQRVLGLDILRIAFALIIFFFHSRIHLHCEYGIFNDFFGTPMIGMSGFFMLSGYAMVVAYGNKTLFDRSGLMMFYKKRLISVYPLYLIAGVLFVLMRIVIGAQTIKDNLILTPIELLGIQSVFDGSLFDYSHNSGTWFVSCILFCYLLFPLIKELTISLKRKKLTFLVIGLIFLLSYIHFLPEYFKCGELYTNPFVRAFEFMLGIVVAELNMDDWRDSRCMRIIRTWPTLIIAVLLLVGCCSIDSPVKYMLIYIGLTLLFISLSYVKWTSNKSHKLLLYASKLSYAFFLAQFFVWSPLQIIQKHVFKFDNIAIILISFVLNCIITIFLYEIIEKRFDNILKKRLLLN